ncbi:hypothetical protein L6452_33306 [Arctium lappa]|uniref:Uncharacterized protein n=1 Tax=Arctium lappa TaxID=4217 RepID=A0ACB8Z6X7_ARCLA|nr:hypothetical protein L6452_33306 [Arctium lappa]
MATQQGPPSRPWFRLATMAARPPAPAQPKQQPNQPPRPTFIRPAFAQTSQPPPPPQPPTNVVPSPTTLPKESPPMPPSPNRHTPPPPASRSTPPPLTATMARLVTNRAATPPTSSPPKTVKPLKKNSPPSPNIKPLSHPPSPLALPSPQLKSYDTPEYDKKSMLVQETEEKPKGSNNGRHMDTHNPISVATKTPEASKKHLDSEDLGMRIITIAGENKGAIMDLTPNKTHNNFGNNPHSLHTKKDNLTASSDGETNSDGKSKAKNKKSKSPLMNSTAIMNSNVQGVNNSIMYNCSTTHHDPGFVITDGFLFV